MIYIYIYTDIYIYIYITEIYKNLSKSFKIYWNLNKIIEIYRNILKLIKKKYIYIYILYVLHRNAIDNISQEFDSTLSYTD